MSLREQRYYAARRIEKLLNQRYHAIIDPILKKQIEAFNKKHSKTVQEINRLANEAHKLELKAERLRTKVKKTVPVTTGGTYLYGLNNNGEVREGQYHDLSSSRHYSEVWSKAVNDKVAALRELREEAEMVIELSGNRDLLGAIKELTEKIEGV